MTLELEVNSLYTVIDSFGPLPLMAVGMVTVIFMTFGRP